MTRNDIGGASPLSDAWEQAETTYHTIGDHKFVLAPHRAGMGASLMIPTFARTDAATTSPTLERLSSRLTNFGKVAVAEDQDDGENPAEAEATDWKPLTFRVLALALLFSSSLIAPALAQTAMGGARQAVPSTPPAPGAQQAQGTPPAQTVPTREMPTSSVFQAVDQSEGIFPQMARAGAGGQVQNAWDVSEARDGVYAVRMCEDCVYKVRLREFMATTIILPPDAMIAAADLGDNVGFQATVKFSNMIAVRPSTYGVDTNLNVYTKSGKVYPFYLRAESFNSINVPDLTVRIMGRETPEAIGAAIPAAATAPGGAAVPTADGRQGKALAPGDMVGAAVADLTNPQPQGNDFVRSVPFDPSKLHGWYDYKLWGGGDAEKELKPIVVYRDGFFTYLQYGRKFDPLELPSAYVVRDGKDELVNSRVQGNTFIVESASRLISIKSGESFLCVEYTGENP